MVLTIYGKDGRRKADIAANDSSTQTKAVQGDNMLALSFTHYAHIALEVNDWCDFIGERYWLTERYAPKQVSESEWTYNLKLLGVESLIKRFLVLETTDGNAEPVFTLTATPREHVAMVVECINDGMGHITDWKVGQVDGDELIVIDYEGKYCDEALKEIAEKAGGKAEWWIEGQTVNVCRCEIGEEITLGYGKGLTSLDRTMGNEKFYTRLFPVGSDRNIDPAEYGHSRLMLPGGQKYVELHTDEYGIYDHYEKDAFAHIYPRRVGKVSSVRSEEKKGEDGKPFTIYYFKDEELNLDPNDYELPGQVKRVSFQSGSLAGLGESDDHYFEVNFDSKTREFEIITIWPYDDDTQLPGGALVPEKDNEYILWNVKMPREYYTIAEDELKREVDKYNEEHWRDVSVYKAPTDHVWVEQQGVELYPGRRVKLESRKYFPDTGYSHSRITKITRKVNLPGQIDLEISDALQTGALERMGDSINDVKNYTRNRTSGSLPDIIRSWDNTLPTDTNLFSARRSQKEFINKNRADRAKKKITFEDGMGIGLENNGGIDAKGNAELLSLVVKELLRSPNGRHGFDGDGWMLSMENALSHLSIDKLTVRQTMTVFELLIQKVRSVGGQICVSAANGRVKLAVYDTDTCRIEFEQENTFVAGDLVRCQTFTKDKLKSYWVEVVAADAGGITVRTSDFPEGTYAEPGDECVLMGNTSNPKRQNLILISATEDGHPRLDVLDGVKDRNFDGCLRVRLGDLDGISDDRFPAGNQPHGNGLYADNAYLRGTFLLSTGEDIKTKFEITEGKIEGAVEGLRQDFAGDKGYLSNSTFAGGMAKWDTQNEAVFFLVGNRWVWANKNVLTKKGDSASVMKDDGRTVVRICNKYIIQKNINLRSIPHFAENAAGKKEALPVYLSFFYRCREAGTLNVRFDNVDKTGFENFNSMDATEELAATEGYVQYQCNGLWNGTGDFHLSFTGDICLYMLILSTDRVESLAYKYKTLFEQSETLLRIAALNFDKDGNVLEGSQILTNAKYNLLISELFNEDGSLKNKSGLVTQAEFAAMFSEAVDAAGLVRRSEISTFVTKDEVGNLISQARIKADQITLEGLVTANGNFKILEDGSVEGKNGSFSGIFNASLFYGSMRKVTEREYVIDPATEPYNWYVIDEPTEKQFLTLPPAAEYEGLELSFFIKNSKWKYDVNTTHIKAADGDSLYTKMNIQNMPSDVETGEFYTFENFGAIYTGDGSYNLMQPNMVIKIKSLFGAWYSIEGLWTGE